MYRFLLNRRSTLLVVMIIFLLSSCCAGTSITLSPLRIISVCPGGQALLTCEIVSGSGFLHWTVSVPNRGTNGRTVADQGDFNPTILFNGLRSTSFTITRTSGNPLTSQMMVNHVINAMNGSTIYCSEDGMVNGAPMTAINIINKDIFLNHLNISLANHFLRNGIRITLQWLQEPGTLYDVNVLPVTQVINTTNHNSIMINLTISYNIQYELNVSISSSLCSDITTTRLLKYVNCGLPSQLLHHPVIVVNGSQGYPLVEGQIITYTCPPGFVQTGPNASVCTGNGEWEPDPAEAYCIADCGVPLVDRNVTLNYSNSSTLEGAILTLTCENDINNTADEQVLNVTCHISGSWIPNPAQFTCSSFATVPPATDSEILIHSSPHSSGESSNLGVILGSVLGVIAIGATAIIIAASAISCLIKKGFLPPKKINTLPDNQVENTDHPYIENLSEQPADRYPVQQQDTLVYADIGSSSIKKRTKHVVTLRPDGTDDRVEYALLNHSIQKPVITTNQDSNADDSLNLDTLLIQIRGAVTSRWFQLGKALAVDKDVLDRCSNYPPEESIVEILDQWLRDFNGRPTWRDVANALRKIDLQQLADDIQMVYETGKLPIQVDDDDAQLVFFTTALELPSGEETSRMDESAPLAGSDVPKEMFAPPRPPKYTPK